MPHLLRTTSRLALAAALTVSVSYAQQNPAPPTPPAATTAAPTPPPPGPPNGQQGRPPRPRAYGPGAQGGPGGGNGPRGPMAQMQHRPYMDGARSFHKEGRPGGGGGEMRGATGHILPPGMWWRSPELVQRLGLTADQQKRMDDIFQSSRIRLIDLKANVEKQEVTLEPLLSANPVDSKTALAQIGRVADARAELEKANAAMLLGIRGVLTPEQWTKLHADDKGRHHMMGMLEAPQPFGHLDGADRQLGLSGEPSASSIGD